MAKVTVYNTRGRPVEIPVREAIAAIKAGTHKAEGRKQGDVPAEWLEETKPRRPVRVKTEIEEIKEVEAEAEEDGKD